MSIIVKLLSNLSRKMIEKDLKNLFDFVTELRHGVDKIQWTRIRRCGIFLGGYVTELGLAE